MRSLARARAAPYRCFPVASYRGVHDACVPLDSGCDNDQASASFAKRLRMPSVYTRTIERAIGILRDWACALKNLRR
jgi:hypothetical protein